MSTIDMILEILKEKNSWQDIEKVAARMDMPVSEIKEIIDLMAKLGFAVVDVTGKKVKLGYMIQEFLEEIAEIETEETSLKL